MTSVETGGRSPIIHGRPSEGVRDELPETAGGGRLSCRLGAAKLRKENEFKVVDAGSRYDVRRSVRGRGVRMVVIISVVLDTYIAEAVKLGIATNDIGYFRLKSDVDWC